MHCFIHSCSGVSIVDANVPSILRLFVDFYVNQPLIGRNFIKLSNSSKKLLLDSILQEFMAVA